MKELRTCKKCNTTKPLVEFKKNCRARTGYLFTCKACDILYAETYRAANPEKVKATQKIYAATHSEEIKARGAAWHAI